MLDLEFIADPLVTEEELVANACSFFVGAKWLQQTDSGLDVIDEKAIKSISYLTRDLMSVYYITLLALDEIADESMTQKEFMKSLSRRLETTEFQEGQLEPTLPSVTVNNALNRLDQMKVIEFSSSRKTLKKLIDPAQREEWLDRLARLIGI
jgi:CRP-like cAMP-binding protein